jgi:4-diphosphocytidyl-2-C-methyl-D-erythritol kinase
MLKFVNAKINIGLNVVRKRPDGYHDLETIFYPIGLHNGLPENPEPFNDILEININNHRDLYNFDGNDVGCAPEDNLVCKAVNQFRKYMATKHPETTLPTGFDIALEKHLPSQAGLGGGSADASFTLLTLNEICGSPLSQDELIELSASIGADCAFFIHNKPCTAFGIGDRLIPQNSILEGLWCAIVKPKESISTKEAFSLITPSGTEKGDALVKYYEAPIESWKELIYNDFEKSFFALHPHTTAIKEALYQHGAAYASLSGSGSAFYGIFHSKEAAMQALDRINIDYKALCLL